VTSRAFDRLQDAVAVLHRALMVMPRVFLARQLDHRAEQLENADRANARQSVAGRWRFALGHKRIYPSQSTLW